MSAPADLLPLKRFMVADARAAAWLARRIVFHWARDSGRDPATLATYDAPQGRLPQVIVESDRSALGIDWEGDFWIGTAGMIKDAVEADVESNYMSASLEWKGIFPACPAAASYGLRSEQTHGLLRLATTVVCDCRIWLCDKIEEGALEMWGSANSELAPPQPIPRTAWWRDAMGDAIGLDHDRAIFTTRQSEEVFFNVHLRWTKATATAAPVKAGKGGRPPHPDRDVLIAYGVQQLEEHGMFSGDREDWKGPADLERAISDYAAELGSAISTSTIRRCAAEALEQFEASGSKPSSERSEHCGLKSAG